MKAQPSTTTPDPRRPPFSPTLLAAPEVEARLLADGRDLIAPAHAVHLAVEGPGGLHEVLERLRAGAFSREAKAYWGARLERVLNAAYTLRESSEVDLQALLDALAAERAALEAEVEVLRR